MRMKLVKQRLFWIVIVCAAALYTACPGEKDRSPEAAEAAVSKDEITIRNVN
jgi:hypothetical protein